MLRYQIPIALILTTGCAVDVPDLDTRGHFACNTDDDCAEDYRCLPKAGAAHGQCLRAVGDAGITCESDGDCPGGHCIHSLTGAKLCAPSCNPLGSACGDPFGFGDDAVCADVSGPSGPRLVCASCGEHCQGTSSCTPKATAVPWEEAATCQM